MREFVLDTHALLAYIDGRRVGRAATRVVRSISDGRITGWVPGVVVVEVALLHERKRTAIGVPAVEATLARNPALQLLPLDLDQAREFALLPSIHDPFDRMIIAAARSVHRPLVTADGDIAASGLVEVVWD